MLIDYTISYLEQQKIVKLLGANALVSSYRLVTKLS